MDAIPNQRANCTNEKSQHTGNRGRGREREKEKKEKIKKDAYIFVKRKEGKKTQQWLSMFHYLRHGVRKEEEEMEGKRVGRASWFQL